MIEKLQSRDNGIPAFLKVLEKLKFNKKFRTDLIATLDLKRQTKTSLKINIVTKQQIDNLKNYMRDNYDTMFKQIAENFPQILLYMKLWGVLSQGNIDILNKQVWL